MECGASNAAMTCLFLNGPNIAVIENFIIFGIAANATIVLRPLPNVEAIDDIKTRDDVFPSLLVA